MNHNFNVSYTRMSADGFAKFYKQEGPIRFDLSEANLSTILLIVNYLVLTGIATNRGIYDHLHDRRSRLSQADVDFLLDEFEGDDPSLALWQRNVENRYLPVGEGLALAA